MSTIKGTTKSGLEYEIDPAGMTDMRVLDALEELSDGNPAGMSRLVKLMFDPQAKKALYAHCSEKDGRVDPQRVGTEVFEIIDAIKNGKN